MKNSMTLFARRLWKYVRPYRSRLILGLVFGMLCALSNGLLVLVIQWAGHVVFPGSGAPENIDDKLKALPEFLRHWIEIVLPYLDRLNPSTQSGVILIVLLIPAVMVIRAILIYLNLYLMMWAAVRAIAELRTALFDHLQNLSLDFFSRARTGELMARINGDTQAIQTIIAYSLATIFRDPLQIIVLLTLLLVQNPGLTLLSLVVMPICVIPITIYGRKMRKSASAAQTHSAELSSLMQETFTGVRIVKAYNLEGNVLSQFKQISSQYVGQVLRVLRANEIPSQTMEVLGSMGVALILIYLVIHRAGLEQQNAGQFLGFVAKIFLMYQPFKSLLRVGNQLHQAAAASEHVFQLLETSNSITDPARPFPLKAANAEIRFDHITFAYGERIVLSDVDITVKAGQMVALVGGSGSGKTTLTNLLLRFYDPQKGSVRIGGTDIRQVAIKDLRAQIALVAQETILFNDTIGANIALGRPGASTAEIEAAAKAAFAHQFIIEKPLGYDTMVGEKGVNLSGGQRQRISIARALLRNAPILVLDEATNQLDNESERIVQAALDDLMKGRTTICIAHRLSTIQNADHIVVLDQGRVVETGTHDELLKRGGTYRRLYELGFQP